MNGPDHPDPRPPWVAAPLLALLPVAACWVWKAGLHPRPFWVHYYDPETSYFYAGFDLLSGHVPHATVHPGTPIQVLSAGLVFLTGEDPLAFDAFRTAGYLVAAILYLLAALLLCRTVLRGLPRSLQIASLWTYFLCPQATEYLVVWSPELFYFPVGALVLALLWYCLTGQGRLGQVFGLGAAVGACCSIKFTFLAFIPAMLVVTFLVSSEKLGRTRAVAACLLGCAGGFLLLTLPIVTAYPRLFAWNFRVATHSGEYGSGDLQVPGVRAMFANQFSLLRNGKVWHLWWFAHGAIALVLLRRGAELAGAVPRRVVFGLLAFAAVGFLANHALATRTDSVRYVLPTGLCGVLVVSTAYRFTRVQSRPRVRLLLLLASGALLTTTLAVDLRTHEVRIRTGEELRRRIELAVAEESRAGDILVYSWRLPQPSFALRITCPEDLVARVERGYPNEGHYTMWSRTLHLPHDADRWDVLVIAEEDWPDFPDREGASVASHVDNYLIVRKTLGP